MCNPIERVEILRQIENVDYKGLSISRSMIKFYQLEGLAGLLKGNLPAIIRILPFSSIEFFSFEFYKNLLIRGGDPKKNSFVRSFFCGALAGLNAITMTFPLDVMRTRLAANTANSSVTDTNLIRSLVALFQTEGIRGLYKGYSITFLVN